MSIFDALIRKCTTTSTVVVFVDIAYDAVAAMCSLDSVCDPFVHGIGTITYRVASSSSANSFIVTGYTEYASPSRLPGRFCISNIRFYLLSFSIWRHDPVTKCAKIWAHSVANPNVISGSLESTTAASYVNDNTVVVSNSSGFLDIFVQHFQ